MTRTGDGDGVVHSAVLYKQTPLRVELWNNESNRRYHRDNIQQSF
jgi:hypothetical protein